MWKKMVAVILVLVVFLAIIGCKRYRDPSMDETFPEYIDDYESPTPPAPPENLGDYE